MTEGTLEFAMRSRAARTSSDADKNRETVRDTVMLDRKLKPGDTLNKLAIQYAVNVADIKRVNNLVNDVEFSALTSVKIPISRMRHALGVSSSSDDDDYLIDADEKRRLIVSDHSRDASVEEIFHKADTVLAQARETLPQDGLHGSFHFVDAKPPESGCSVWVLLACVIILFMVVPLVLTFLEESENTESR